MENKEKESAARWIGENVEKLPSPSFVISLPQFKINCDRMRARASSLGLALRPHVKTHKTIEGAKLQTDGLPERQIVVSTLEEARFFAKNGFSNILYGVVLEPSKVAVAEAIKQSIKSFHILLDNVFMIDYLEKRPDLGPWSVFVKVDCGYHRAGVDPKDPATLELIKRLQNSSRFNIQGIYSHSGNSYNCKCAEGDDGIEGVKKAARSVATEEADVLSEFHKLLASEGIEVPVVSIGSTPSCSTVEACGSCNEIHPGNYCLYDRQQVASGSCSLEDVACYVLARVLSVYPARKEFLFDCGATALHKDPAGITHWGHIIDHPEWKMTRLTQECCVVTCDTVDESFQSLVPGTVLRIIPNHSCMTAAGYAEYFIEEEGKIVDVWRPCKFW